MLSESANQPGDRIAPAVSIARIGPTDRWLQGWGSTLLYGAFSFGILLTLLITWKASWLIPFLPALLLGGIGMWWLFQHPVANLCVLIGSYAVIAGFDDGTTVVEVLYLLYFFAYFFAWGLDYCYLKARPILESAADVAILFFLVWVTGSFALTLTYDASLSLALSEWSAVLMLALYFPVSRLARDAESGPFLVAALFIFLGVVLTFRNMIAFQAILSDASMAWEVARGRVVDNELLLLIPALIALIALVYERNWKKWLPYMGVFLLTFVSLILTQSRAYWLDFVFGGIAVFVLVSGREKRRLLLISVLGGLGALLAGYLFLGDTLWLLITGVLQRVMTIFTAAQQDISVINRFYETSGVWPNILESPIIGHGLGTSYRVFDIIEGISITKPFVHNGFMLLWFKYGIVGLITVIYFWFRGIRSGLIAFRQQNGRKMDRIWGLCAAVCLISLFPSSLTSLPFYLSDSLLAYGLLIGWAEGIRYRDKNHV